MSALPGFLTRNWTLKLSAFGIALLLWVSVRVEAPSRQTLDGVPVRIDVADPNWALAGDPLPASVAVRFQAPSRELIRMAVDRPAIVVPLDRIESRDTTIILRSQHVRVQDRQGVSVEDIQPVTVRLTFEPVRRMEIPVSVRLTGELPSEWALVTPPAPIPGDVRVTGPESRVLELDSVPLRPLDLGMIEGPSRVGLEVDTTATSGLRVQPTRVEVDVSVEERVERRLEGVRVIIRRDGWEEDYELDRETVTVILTGARSLVERIAATGLLAVVEPGDDGLPEEEGEERTLPLRVVGVPGLLEGRPEEEEVAVRRRESASGGGVVPP